METIVRIKNIGSLTQRTFQDNNGQSQIIHVRELSLSAGSSRFVGQMTGKTAMNFNENDPEWLTALCLCHFDIVSRSYQTERGYSTFTDIRINRIEKL